MNIKAFQTLQNEMPWTDLWDEGILGCPRPYAFFQHCMTNIAAKMGAIFQRIEMSDHYGADYAEGLNREKDAAALAIIVMSAMKAANCYPGGPVDLAAYINADLQRRAGGTSRREGGRT